MVNESNGIWRERLIAELEAAKERGRKYRDISLKAGLGPNYVGQFMQKDRKKAQTNEILQLCRSLNVSPAYIFTGIEMTAESEEWLRILNSLTEDQRKQLREFLHSMRRAS